MQCSISVLCATQALHISLSHLHFRKGQRDGKFLHQYLQKVIFSIFFDHGGEHQVGNPQIVLHMD